MERSRVIFLTELLFGSSQVFQMPELNIVVVVPDLASKMSVHSSGLLPQLLAQALVQRKPLCQSTACELQLLEHSTATKLLTVQHGAASIILCYGPPCRGIGNFTQDLLQIAAAWALLCTACHLQREVTLVSAFCFLLGLRQGQWLSLVPASVKYVGSRHQLHFLFCMSRPCNRQERSMTGPMYAIGKKGKVFGTWYGTETNEQLLCSD